MDSHKFIYMKAAEITNAIERIEEIFREAQLCLSYLKNDVEDLLKVSASVGGTATTLIHRRGAKD
jgi:hypothetical protein